MPLITAKRNSSPPLGLRCAKSGPTGRSPTSPPSRRPAGFWARSLGKKSFGEKFWEKVFGKGFGEKFWGKVFGSPASQTRTQSRGEAVTPGIIQEQIPHINPGRGLGAPQQAHFGAYHRQGQCPAKQGNNSGCGSGGGDPDNDNGRAGKWAPI